MSDVFALQDRITENVVGAIEPKLLFAEAARLKQKSVSSLDAYDFYLRALQLEYEFTKESLDEAICCLGQAAAIDPSFAPAMALAAFCYAERAFQAWAKDYEAEVSEALRLANRAVELDPQNAEVLWMSAYPTTFLAADHARAKELFDRSFAINPNSPMALTMSSWAEINLDNRAIARERLARARRVSPCDPHEWKMSMTMADMWDHRFPESLAWAERAIRQNPRALPVLRTMVVSLVHSGRRERAAEVVQDILRIDAKFSVSSWQRHRAPSYRRVNPRWQFILDAYRAAGVPD
jgi:tetratricopeptide (TPR) repeat protein